jgi:hypothetical protein
VQHTQPAPGGPQPLHLGAVVQGHADGALLHRGRRVGAASLRPANVEAQGAARVTPMGTPPRASRCSWSAAPWGSRL